MFFLGVTNDFLSRLVSAERVYQRRQKWLWVKIGTQMARNQGLQPVVPAGLTLTHTQNDALTKS